MIKTDTRQIQNFGIIKLPENTAKIKWYRLVFDLLKPPISTYQNNRYPVPQGFLGYVQSIYAERVLQTFRISYDNEVITEFSNINLWIHQINSCALEAILTSFVNLGNSLNVIPIQRNNPIKDFVPFATIPDRFRIQLLTEDTYANITLEYEEMETCEVPGSEDSPAPPPPPPPPPAQLPPDTPAANIPPNAPPYEGPDDDGETFNPGDRDPDDFPVGEDCLVYRVTVTVAISADQDDNATSVALYLGPIEDVFVGIAEPGDTTNSVIVIAHGKPGGECTQEPQRYFDLIRNNVIDILQLDITLEEI